MKGFADLIVMVKDVGRVPTLVNKSAIVYFEKWRNAEGKFEEGMFRLFLTDNQSPVKIDGNELNFEMLGNYKILTSEDEDEQVREIIVNWDNVLKCREWSKSKVPRCRIELNRKLGERQRSFVVLGDIKVLGV